MWHIHLQSWDSRWCQQVSKGCASSGSWHGTNAGHCNVYVFLRELHHSSLPHLCFIIVLRHSYAQQWLKSEQACRLFPLPDQIIGPINLLDSRGDEKEVQIPETEVFNFLQEMYVLFYVFSLLWSMYKMSDSKSKSFFEAMYVFQTFSACSD